MVSVVALLIGTVRRVIEHCDQVGDRTEIVDTPQDLSPGAARDWRLNAPCGSRKRRLDLRVRGRFVHLPGEIGPGPNASDVTARAHEQGSVSGSTTWSYG